MVSNGHLPVIGCSINLIASEKGGLIEVEVLMPSSGMVGYSTIIFPKIADEEFVRRNAEHAHKFLLSCNGWKAPQTA